MVGALIFMQLVFITISLADLSCQPLVPLKCLSKLLLIVPLLFELLLDKMFLRICFAHFVQMMLCRRADATVAIFIHALI